MSEKKGTTVLLTVIGIATLLVTLVGATFAYFTAKVEESDNSVDTDVTVTAATLGTVTFAHENQINFCDEDEAQPCLIYPGESDSVDFSITSAANSTAPINYEIYLLTETNTVAQGKTETSNLVATLTAPGTTEAGYESLLNATPLATGTYKTGDTTTGVKIGEGVLQPGGASDTWTLNVTLNEINDEQNDDQGRIFKGSLKVVAGTKYTAQGAVWSSTSGN